MDLLPDDVLADVLRRLPARSLATARGVCHAWRTVIDDRSLMQVTTLLPNSVRGLFVLLNMPYLQGFFARPSPAGPVIPGLDLDYLDINYLDDLGYPTVNDHCNGLLLFDEHVVNPATRQWARLPPMPEDTLDIACEVIPNNYWGLLFDPAESPHYEVLSMPMLLRPLPTASVLDQWPPSPLVLPVFSSRTVRWEEQSFTREGDTTMGTIADICALSLLEPDCNTHSVYLRGALYMHCQNDCIIKITPANHKYRVIKLPGNFVLSQKYNDLYLGKSKGRVYYALVTFRCRLQIWCLNETESSPSSSNSYSSYDRDGYEWVLEHEADLRPMLASCPRNNGGRQWIWHNADTKEDKRKELPVNEEEFEWAVDDTSNDEDDNSSGTGEDIHYDGYISMVLGFHPFKDIVFLYDTDIRIVAYHYRKAKVQDLGMLFIYQSTDRVISSFPYTPCWIRDLPEMRHG